MTDHNTTAGKARAFEFSFSAHADAEPERMRFVIGERGYGFERLHGHDRMGAERWVCHSIEEQDFDAVVRALLLAFAPRPSDAVPPSTCDDPDTEPAAFDEPLLDDEWSDDGSLDVQAELDAEQRAAESDGWHTEGLPPLGAWAEVRVGSGEVYTGEVTVASDSDAHIRLRGDASGPYAGDAYDEWSTWGSVPAERRTGWRLAKRPTRDTVTMAYTVDGQEREVSAPIAPAERERGE